MLLLVVRHAHAGAKDRWSGDDLLRPLSDRGHQQALALVETLAPYEPARVVSSPFVRCLQTVGPLAAHVGLPVEESEALGPQSDRDAARLLRSLASGRQGVVVCTHGETIEALQRRLARPGKLTFGPGGAHEKGSVWILHASGGRFRSSTYLPPGVPPPDGSPEGAPEVAPDGTSDGTSDGQSDGQSDGHRTGGADGGARARGGGETTGATEDEQMKV